MAVKTGVERQRAAAVVAGLSMPGAAASACGARSLADSLHSFKFPRTLLCLGNLKLCMSSDSFKVTEVYCLLAVAIRLNGTIRRASHQSPGKVFAM